MSAQTSWARVPSGRSSMTSNSPVRMYSGSRSTAPTQRSATPNPHAARPKISSTSPPVNPPSELIWVKTTAIANSSMPCPIACATRSSANETR